MTEPGDCRHCKDYRECFGLKDWWHYGEIRFCVYQVIFILRHAETLRAGHWPQDPDSSSDNNPGGRNIKTEATFARPVLILAEVESRLERTGIHGELLLAQIEAGREYSTISGNARAALMYVKGLGRKRMSFNAWKKQRKHRQNDYQKVVKEAI